jgi:hypothetical protein
VIENAFVLAATRRLIRPVDAPPLGTIRSLTYFLPAIEEVLDLRGGAVSEDLFRRGICLPSSSSLTASEQAAVVRQVRKTTISGQLAALGQRLTDRPAATVAEPQPAAQS